MPHEADMKDFSGCHKPVHGKGTNLLLLLGLPLDSRVLVIGCELEGWRKVFPHCQFFFTLPLPKVLNEAYDLILYHSGCAVSPLAMLKHLKRIKGMIEENCIIIFFYRNFFSIANLKLLKAGKWCHIRRQVRLGEAGFRRVMETAGVPGRHMFHVLPSLKDGDEFVDPDGRFLEIPKYFHFLYHFAHRLGCFRLVADGGIFLGIQHAIEHGSLVRVVTRQLSSAERLSSNDFHLERFDLRQRGALALFITEKKSGQSYIARVVSDCRSQKIIRHNQEFLKGLWFRPDLKGLIGEQVPRPIGELMYEECSIFLETLLTGIPAWKVNIDRLRNRIFHEASHFIFQLQFNSRSLTVVENEELSQLFDDDLNRISYHKSKAPSFLEGIACSIREVKKILSGQRIFLSLSHGDYGYGNILVNPRTGKLTGVIDWDTGRTFDMPGVDFLNLVIQKIRTEKGISFSSAFLEASSMVISRGTLDETGLWRTKMGITSGLLPAIIYTTFLRDVSRAARHPEMFFKSIEEYSRTLEYLQDKVLL